MNIFWSFIVTVFLGACTKEKITLYHANLKNNTTHKIEIKPYFNGTTSIDKIVTLMPNETHEIANGFDRGIVGNAGFTSRTFSGSDSIIVIFDNIYSITHYFNSPVFLSKKFYFLTSNRNIYNKDNYLYSYNDLSKNKRESNYVYEFIDQDYLDAK